MNRYSHRLVLFLSLLLGTLNDVRGETAPRKIQDNSFLLEEAYNQEPGVIQHIQTFNYIEEEKAWNYSFTEEWPMGGQRHQLSVTLPAAHRVSFGSDTQIEDALLNYRYQLIGIAPVAFAPRLSLVCPTGRVRDGFGSGAPGVQANLPLSVDLGPRFVVHANAGTTFLPKAGESGGFERDLNAYNYGASLIGIVTDNFNLMLELAGNWSEVIEGDGRLGREESVFLNPAVRFAFDFESGLQIVPGIGFPIGIGTSKGEESVFFYLSLEHPWLVLN